MSNEFRDPEEQEVPTEGTISSGPSLQALMDMVNTYLQGVATHRADVMRGIQETPGGYRRLGRDPGAIPGVGVVPMGPPASGALLTTLASRFPEFYKYIQTKMPQAETFAVRPSYQGSGALRPSSSSQGVMDWEVGATQINQDYAISPLKTALHEFLHQAYSRPDVNLRRAVEEGETLVRFGERAGMEGLLPLSRNQLITAVGRWLDKEGYRVAEGVLRRQDPVNLSHLMIELMSRNMMKRRGLSVAAESPLSGRVWAYLKSPYPLPQTDPMVGLVESISRLER